MRPALVSIQRVDGIEPIAGATQIVKARVRGWDVVVPKHAFAPGERCVFFEIDSVLPDGPPWSEFLRPRGFRVRTARLRGVLAQGLALPLDILPGAVPPVGTDVRHLLGVDRHQAARAGAPTGPYPAALPRLDEVRLQSAPAVLDELRGHDFCVLTRVGGAPVAYHRPLDGPLVACAQDGVLTRTGDPAWRAADTLGLATALPPGFAILGELADRERAPDAPAGLLVASVYDGADARFLDRDEQVEFCAARGLASAPVEAIVEGDAALAHAHTLAGWIAAARGELPGGRRKAGIVVRPLRETRSTALGGRLSFAVDNNDHLLHDA